MAAFTGESYIDKDRERSAIDPNSKFADYDVAGLEALSDENAPSPSGAASQGALGTPPPGGETPALEGAEVEGEEQQDMLTIFNQSTPEDREHLVDKVTESYAPHGLSLEGAMDNALMKGGPHAIARAAEFGVDLTAFADKMDPAGKEAYQTKKTTRQAFGSQPPEGKAGTAPYKTEAAAMEDQDYVERSAEVEQAAKKKAQREAIAAFLIEAGLRTIASARDDVGGAMAEGALGTMEARRGRARQTKQDTIAEAQRKRQIEREDAADEAAKLRAQQQTEEYEYEKSQRPAEEAKAERAGLEEITNDAGEVYYFDPLDPQKGKYVTDEAGNRIKSEDAGLSKAQVATNARAYKAARAKARTAIEKDIKEYDTQYPEIAEETDAKAKAKLIDAAVDAVLERDGYDLEGNPQETNYLDW